MKPGESQPLLATRSNSVGSATDVQINSKTRCRAAIALPLVVLTYFLSYYTAVVILNPYLYDLVAEEYHFKLNSSSQRPCTEHHGNITNTTEKKIQEIIQKQVSTTELYISLPCFVGASLSILVVGPLTDKYGRKFGMLFPIFGTILKQVVYLAVVGLRLHPLVFIVGHVFESLGGSFAAMLTSMFTVVSDITTPGPQRSLRITIMEALQTLTGAAGGYAVGQWIMVSYLHPLIFSLVMSIVSLCLALFLLPETMQTRRLVAPAAVTYPGCCQRFRACCRSVPTVSFHKFKRTFVLFINDTCGKQLLVKRRLAVSVFILTVAVNFSTPGVQNLYLMKFPRCWSVTRILSFGSIQLLCNWVAILCLMKLLQKLFKMTDRHIAIIGVVSSLISAVFMSQAVNDVMIYEVAVISVMVRAIIPMLRSIMSSLVDSVDQGAMYASLGCLEILGAAAFGVIANRLYYATVSTWDGSVFIMFAGIMGVALVLLIILNILFEKNQEGENEAGCSIPVGNIQEGPDPSW